jgi:hypothetical protein
MTGETPGDSESRWMSPEELASAIGSVIKKIELVVAQPKDINVNNLVPYATFSEEFGISSVVAATPPRERRDLPRAPIPSRRPQEPVKGRPSRHNAGRAPRTKRLFGR